MTAIEQIQQIPEDLHQLRIGVALGDLCLLGILLLLAYLADLARQEQCRRRRQDEIDRMQ